MKYQSRYLAALSYIDQRLDELQDEYGDLPEKIKQAQKKSSEKKALVDETEQILKDIKNFYSSSKLTLMEMKDKEEKLSKKQFLVRNNKEFDAITKEIEHLRHEHERLSDRLRIEGMKEENLLRILAQQKLDRAEAESEYTDIKKELEHVSSDQNIELKDLYEKRDKIISALPTDLLNEYERIRKTHTDAAMPIRRNSCSGCFSSVPPQKIVEIRNNLEKVFLCENCGRILLPEDISVEETIVDQVL